MADIAQATEYLQSLLNSPLMEADPVYQELKGEGITRMLKVAALSYGYSTFDSVPETDLPAIFLSTRREIYLTLATQTAPEYDVETEFTKLLKSKRFDHYIRLVTEVSNIIAQQASMGMLGGVTAGDMIISSRDGMRGNYLTNNNTGARNYALANAQTADITVVPASTSAEFTWKRFDPKLGNFGGYRLLVGANLYDPYVDIPIKLENAVFNTLFRDINRTQYRVTGLTPDTDYEVLIELVSNSGKKDIKVVSFKTLV